MVKVTQNELTEWFELCERLDNLASFRFEGVTLRKEQRRQTHYWYGYKRINGKLFNWYCGDKWKLREQLPNLADNLAKKSRGEHVPSVSSSKVEAVSEVNEWFEAWSRGKVGRTAARR